MTHPVLDGHVHFFYEGYFPEEWFQAKARLWSGRRWPHPPPEDILDRLEPGILDPEGAKLVEDLHRAGIAGGLHVGVDAGWAFTPETPSDLAYHIERQARALSGQSNLFALVGIDPRRRDAVRHLRWAVDELGFRGLKLYPPHGFSPADERCFPLYEEMARRRLPVMFHTAVTDYPLVSHYANPLLIQEVQRRFPNLRVILAHAGYPLWEREAAQVARGHPHTFLEVSQWNRLLPGEPERLAGTLGYFRAQVGAHRMIFGSDHYSGWNRDDAVDRLRAWRSFAQSTDAIADGERELFLHGNLDRIMSPIPGTERGG